MIIYQENYGQDIDGNRGRLEWNYVIEDFDYEEVKEKVLNAIWEDGYSLETLPKFILIPMYNYITDEEVYIEVCPEEYLEEV